MSLCLCVCVLDVYPLYSHCSLVHAQEELQRGNHDDRSSVATGNAERKVDAASASAAANYNKIKSIQTQLQAKFVDTAPNPAPPTGLRRQVNKRPRRGSGDGWGVAGGGVVFFSKVLFGTFPCEVFQNQRFLTESQCSLNSPGRLFWMACLE